MKLNYSGLPFRKTMDQFDFSFQPSIDRKDFLSSKLSYRLATYARVPLKIVYEIGYLPLTMEE